jgi:hypothetical protein
VAHKISVRSGFQVNIPGVGEVDGPVTDMVVSDDTFEALNPNSMSASDSTKPLIDRGFIDTSGDAVLTQATNVAAPAALTSAQNATANATDLATAQALANSLKTSYNALQTDVVALRATVANLLAAITGTGKAMSS